MSETVDLNENQQDQNEQAATELLAAFSPKSTQDAIAFLKQQKEGTTKAGEGRDQPSETSPKSENTDDSQKDQGVDPSSKESGQKEGKGEKKDFEALYGKLLKESEVKEKLAEDNKRHARQLARNVSTIKQHILELQESGAFDEDTAKSLLDVASKNVDPNKILTPEDKSSKEKLPAHLAGLEELASNAKEVLEKYLELSPNADQEKNHAAGFDVQVSLMSDEERQSLYEDLKKHQDSPKALLKSMLDIGREFWEGSLGKGLKEHGSLMGIIDAQASTIEDLNGKIAKLEKNSKKETEKDDQFKNSHAPSPVRKFAQYSPEEMLRREWAGA
jgi:hypothetical protein